MWSVSATAAFEAEIPAPVLIACFPWENLAVPRSLNKFCLNVKSNQGPSAQEASYHARVITIHQHPEITTAYNESCHYLTLPLYIKHSYLNCYTISQAFLMEDKLCIITFNL